MACVTCITPCPPDISAFGTRSLSAAVRAAGHETRLVFFPGNLGLAGCGAEIGYPSEVVDTVVRIAEGSDLVLISFMSSYLSRAMQLTRAMRDRLGVPVAWGGIHALRRPADVLQLADYALRGEGEEAVPALLAAMQNGGDTGGIPGIWSMDAKSGEQRKNGLAIVRDISSLPYYDFSNENHYMYQPEYGSVVRMDDALLEECLPQMPYFRGRLLRTYRTMTDRGCPHSCTYCNIPTIKNIFREDSTPYFRHRSPESVLGELEFMTRRFPFVEAIQIFDDTFFSRPKSWFDAFCPAYKERIGMPLYAQASPGTLSPEKMERMVQAGMVYVEMGVQTGSTKIRRLYNRKETNEIVVEMAKMVRCYMPRVLRPDYHIIIDNPWETEEDFMDTVRLLHAMPRPYGLCLASLIIFPDTALFRKAIADGLIEEPKEADRAPFHVRHQKNYPGFLLYLLTFPHFPKPLMSLLLRDDVAGYLRRKNPTGLYKGCFMVGEFVRLAVKGGTLLLQGRLNRLGSYVKRRFFTKRGG